MKQDSKKNKLNPNEVKEDKINILRPKKIEDFIGQDLIKSNLKTFIDSSVKSKKNLDHIILYGPPGLGKTTLANIISYEKNVNIHATSGPAFSKKGDLVTLLSNLGKGDILFIDEIHRLSPVIEETLYPAMEDFKCDYVIGSGPFGKSNANLYREVYTYRCNHKIRIDIEAIKRSIWNSIAIRLL